MTWRPERGWISLATRVGAAACGAFVLATGLSQAPGLVAPTATRDAAVVRTHPVPAHPARPLILREPAATRDDSRAKAARPGASDRSQASPVPVEQDVTEVVEEDVGVPAGPPPPPANPPPQPAGGSESDDSSGPGNGEAPSQHDSSGSGSGGSGSSGGGSGSSG